MTDGTTMQVLMNYLENLLCTRCGVNANRLFSNTKSILCDIILIADIIYIYRKCNFPLLTNSDL